ncbi:MAG TPA: hypothetical protein VM285_07960 [Polyangia bacterium]|nr:hypothetical protein [Polyangia bacterium]
MRFPKVTLAVLALALLAAPAALMARSVFLNGVEISHLKDQTFKDTTVHIDKDGNIHIEAPGYKVKVVDDDAVAAAPGGPVEAGANPALRMQIFLTTRPSAAAQYDLLVSVNGVQRKVIKAGEPALIMEVSSWFAKGENKVTIKATKKIENGRKSVSAGESVGLILGAGHEEDSVVKIQSVFVDFRANASQIVDHKKTYTFNAI